MESAHTDAGCGRNLGGFFGGKGRNLGIWKFGWVYSFPTEALSYGFSAVGF